MWYYWWLPQNMWMLFLFIFEHILICKHGDVTRLTKSYTCDTVCPVIQHDSSLTVEQLFVWLVVNGTNLCSKSLFSRCCMCTKGVTYCQTLIISVVSVCVSASPCLVCVWWPSIRPSISWMSSLHPASGATTTLSCLGITVMLITSHPMEWSTSTVF